MTDQLLKFAGDKLVPLVLIVMGGVAYKLNLPADYCAGIGAAGLLAFQIDRKAQPANPTQPPQGPNA